MANLRSADTPATVETVTTAAPEPVPVPVAPPAGDEDTGVRRIETGRTEPEVSDRYDRERVWSRWGGVIAGFVLAVGAQLLLGLLGHAISFSAVAIASAPGAKFAAAFAVVWFAAEALITTFFGGYMAARLSTTVSARDGAISGALTWALGIVLALGAVGALGVGGFELGATAPFMTQSMSMVPAEVIFAWSVFALAVLSLVTSMLGGAAGARRLTARRVVV